MPNIGETKKAVELGYKGHAIYVYELCAGCNIPRWKRQRDPSKFCRHCGYKESATSLVVAKGAKRASEVGRHYKGNPWLYPYTCPVCGKDGYENTDTINRKMACSYKCGQLKKSAPRRGANHPMWTGGRHIRKDGYIEILLQPDNPYYPMMRSARGVVLEHRVVVAQSLGRCLEPYEIVHHKNRNRSDNRLENLELLGNQAGHLTYIAMEIEIKKLRAEVNLLKWHIKDLEYGNTGLNSGTEPDKCVEDIYPASLPDDDMFQPCGKPQDKLNPEHPRPRNTAGALEGDFHCKKNRSRGNLNQEWQGNPEPSNQSNKLAGVRRDYGVLICNETDGDIVRTSLKGE